MAIRKDVRVVSRREQIMVALVMDSNPWLREEAQERGWRLVNIMYSDGYLPPDVVPRGALIETLPDAQMVQAINATGCPVVRLGHLPHPDDRLVPAILHDQSEEGRLAAEHFFERGFLDVGFFGSDPWSVGEKLFEAFRACAEQRGMACHLHRFKPDSKESHTRKQELKRCEFDQWIREVPKPFGLLVPGSVLAVAQCMWMQQAGLAIPHDVAVLVRGAHVDLCESSMPTLSSLDLDEERRTRVACDLLDRLMAGAPVPTAPIKIPPRGIVERESTNVLATADCVVAAALRYMWDHLNLNLSDEDVAQAVGVSRRQLSRRFQSALGRSITDEWRRKRLATLKGLLRSTDLKVADLAPKVGFRSTTYLHRTFRAAFGVTPAQYRRSIISNA
jgi:LacI family transcriptional regulator